MFTGIVEEIGVVKGFTRNSQGATIKIGCSKVLDGTKIGDSIAVNGCCQTVVSLDNNSFTANISNETLNITTLSEYKSGRQVNLERALSLNTRLGGHIVQGHVDCKGVYLGNSRFEISKDLAKYLVYKGSVTIDGVSLTIAEVEDNIFSVALISHTMENTTLKTLSVGDRVNIETDILGRYVEKLLGRADNKITADFLKENGFM